MLARLTLFSALLVAAPSPAWADADFVPGQVLIKWRRQPTGAEATMARAAINSKLIKATLTQSRVELINLRDKTKKATLAAIATLQKNPAIEIAEPNYIRRIMAKPNDQHYPLQWNLREVKLEQAWDQTTGNNSIVVAVVDTGIRKNHPDLAGRLLPGFDFITDAANANDGGGRDSDATDTGSNTASGGAFHGTHVAGIIGAIANNKVGIAGVNWHCRILPVRALGVKGGRGTDADIAAAIRWAGGLAVSGIPKNPYPAKVINLSFGAPNEGKILTQAISEVIAVGVIVAAAAGNDTGRVDNIFPAAIPAVITVGATKYGGGRAAYSNFGAAVDVMAPGGLLSSFLPFTHPGKAQWEAGIVSTMYYAPSTGKQPHGYHMYEGTSQAVPLVAGVISLMLTVNPRLTPDQVAAILKNTANPSGRCPEGCGAGLLDASRALTLAKNPPTTPPPNPNQKGAFGTTCSADAQCQESICRQVLSAGPICTRFCSTKSHCPTNSNCQNGLCTPNGVTPSTNNPPPDNGGTTSVVGTMGCSMGTPSEGGVSFAMLLLLAIILVRRRRAPAS